ncbi:hypothetical protein [Paenibacillus aestuarii]|uniref:YtzI protein n=1 Tax=Paenibacillus aestuarii TaxID=516965 RepID=A0ABW0K5C8_9BACL|nr:hypothetical protein [Paenibacillus aestuarii]
MGVTIGILLIVVACLFAWWIVRLAGKSIREFDESKHENFLGK